jgi:hypothetical protein
MCDGGGLGWCCADGLMPELGGEQCGWAVRRVKLGRCDGDDVGG